MKKINSISIIDDDPITTFGIKKLLNNVVECGQVTNYTNGKQAIDDISNKLNTNGQIPDVIFLDINMPIMDGWQFLAEFIKLPINQKVRINVITSSIDPVDKAKCEKFQKQSHHLITFNNKPIANDDIRVMARVA